MTLENIEALSIEIVIPVLNEIQKFLLFHNLKSYLHFIRQELGKFDLKTNVIPNGLQKYISFGINNKLSIIDIFQFLSSHKEI